MGLAVNTLLLCNEIILAMFGKQLSLTLRVFQLNILESLCFFGKFFSNNLMNFFATFVLTFAL